MFDDQNTNQGGQVPGNLPIGEPEDMFASTDGGGAPFPEPMPAPAIPSALDAGILKPKETAPAEEVVETAPPLETPSMALATAPAAVPPDVANQPPTAPPAGIPEQPEMYKIKEPTLSKGLMTAIIVGVVLVIVVGGGWIIYTKFVKSDGAVDGFAAPANDTEILIQDTEIEPEVVETFTSPAEIVELPQEIVDENILFGEPIDRDDDGLDDIREADLGTDPKNWDSDGDGLSDGDEVIIWKTNPLDSDTDGDTYADGLEVKSGYSPTGPGQLYEVPTSTP